LVDKRIIDVFRKKYKKTVYDDLGREVKVVKLDENSNNVGNKNSCNSRYFVFIPLRGRCGVSFKRELCV